MLNDAIQWRPSDQIVIYAGTATSDDERNFAIPFWVNGIMGHIIGKYVPTKGTTMEVQMTPKTPGNETGIR
jgi:hypothetical protein